MFGQGTGVDLVDSNNLVLGEIISQRLLGPPGRRNLAEFTDDKSPNVGTGRFCILRVDSVVPLQRVGHRYNLPTVGGIGNDLLIPRHGGIKANFPGSSSGMTKGTTAESATVFKSENGVRQGDGIRG